MTTDAEVLMPSRAFAASNYIVCWWACDECASCEIRHPHRDIPSRAPHREGLPGLGSARATPVPVPHLPGWARLAW